MASTLKTSAEQSARIERLHNAMYAAMVSDLHVIESDRMWSELDLLGQWDTNNTDGGI